MRNMKLSDVSLDKFGSLIVEAEEYPLKEDKSPTPKGYKEVSANLCQAGKKVVYPLRFSLNPFSLHGQNVDAPFVIEAMYRFYVSKFKEEYSKFYSSRRAAQIRQEISPMCLEIANLKTNETLVRIGHFSHVECITLDDVRQPRTRLVKGRAMPFGTTRTLANGLYPFGWAKLEFIDLKPESRGEEDWPFSIQELEGDVRAKEEAVRKSEREAEAAEKRRKQEEEKRQAEEKRMAELEGMSPEERDIEKLRDPSINEIRVVEIFGRIDEFTKENKTRVARALKEYWVSQGKWKKKDCSKKQLIKVQKTKEILGDL